MLHAHEQSLMYDERELVQGLSRTWMETPKLLPSSTFGMLSCVCVKGKEVCGGVRSVADVRSDTGVRSVTGQGCEVCYRPRLKPQTRNPIPGVRCDETLNREWGGVRFVAGKDSSS